MMPSERLGRALLHYAHRRGPDGSLVAPYGTGRPRRYRVAAAVGSWFAWGAGWRSLRRHPVWYVRGVVERLCQRLAVRWYPEYLDDFEDCEACSITDDVCVYHRGIESCATYVEKRVSPDLAASLFPES